MARGIRHARINRAMARSASQRISASHGSATTGDASQRTGIAAAPQVEQPKKKRKEARVPNKIGAATTRNQGGPYTKW